MTDYLVAKLPNKVIPLTKGCDRLVAVRRKNDVGDPDDWYGDVYMLIDLVMGSAPEQIDAVVDGDLATITISSDIADDCRNHTTWRIIYAENTDPTTENALLVGTFERNDGR